MGKLRNRLKEPVGQQTTARVLGVTICGHNHCSIDKKARLEKCVLIMTLKPVRERKETSSDSGEIGNGQIPRKNHLPGTGLVPGRRLSHGHQGPGGGAVQVQIVKHTALALVISVFLVGTCPHSPFPRTQ